MSRILITGGCGYLGSHTCLALKDCGHQVALFDLRQPVFPLGVPVYNGDATDAHSLAKALKDWRADQVIHLAGKIEARESVQFPVLYLHHNVGSTIALLRAMEECGLRDVVFASTGSVHGTHGADVLAETDVVAPQSPYASSKLLAEEVLRTASKGVRAAIFRFFNAAGADPKQRAGELHDPETHLIPLLLLSALGQGPTLTVMGNDHPTPDGSCVRDYVHVADIADAMVAGLAVLRAGHPGGVFNLGSGHGHSVLEVVEACRDVTGLPIPITMGARREGDPAKLVANIGKAKQELGWTPHRSNIRTIVADAWNFLISRPAH